MQLKLTISIFALLACQLTQGIFEFKELAEKKPAEVADWYEKAMREKPEETSKRMQDALKDRDESIRKSAQSVMERLTQAFQPDQLLRGNNVQAASYYVMMLSDPIKFRALAEKLPETSSSHPFQFVPKLVETYTELLRTTTDPQTKALVSNGLARMIEIPRNVIDKVKGSSYTLAERDKAAAFAENVLAKFNQEALQKSFLTKGFIENALTLADQTLHTFLKTTGEINQERTAQNLKSVFDFLKKLYDAKSGIDDPFHSIPHDIVSNALGKTNLEHKLKSLRDRSGIMGLRANQIELILNRLKSLEEGADESSSARLFEEVLSPEAQALDPETARFFKSLLSEKIKFFENTKKYLADALKNGDYQKKLQEYDNEMMFKRVDLATRTSYELRNLEDKDLIAYWENWKLILSNPYINPVDNFNALNTVLTNMRSHYYEGTNPENVNAYYAISRNLLRYAVEKKLPTALIEKAASLIKNDVKYLLADHSQEDLEQQRRQEDLKKNSLISISDPKWKENRAEFLSRQHQATLTMLSQILLQPDFKKLPKESQNKIIALQANAFKALNAEGYRLLLQTVPTALRVTIIKAGIESAASAETAGGPKLAEAIKSLREGSESNASAAMDLLAGLNSAVINPAQSAQFAQAKNDLLKSIMQSNLQALDAVQLNTLVNALANLKALDATQLKALANALANLKGLNAAQINALINSLAKLQGLDATQISTLINALANRKGLDAEQLNALANALAKNLRFARDFLKQSMEQPNDPDLIVALFTNFDAYSLLESMSPKTIEQLATSLREGLARAAKTPAGQEQAFSAIAKTFELIAVSNEKLSQIQQLRLMEVIIDFLAAGHNGLELLNKPNAYWESKSDFYKPTSITAKIIYLTQQIKAMTIDHTYLENFNNKLIALAHAINIEQLSKNDLIWQTKVNLARALKNLAFILGKPTDSSLFITLAINYLRGASALYHKSDNKLDILELYHKDLSRPQVLADFEETILILVDTKTPFTKKALSDLQKFKEEELARFKNIIEHDQFHPL